MSAPPMKRIWGRSCQSLYEDANSLLDTVMPEDRGRLAAALAEQSLLPQTEIEYRILRPDHSLRWIRTRTFPRSNQRAGRLPGGGRFAGYHRPQRWQEKPFWISAPANAAGLARIFTIACFSNWRASLICNKVLQQRLGANFRRGCRQRRSISANCCRRPFAKRRALARGLNPVQLEAHGLMATLKELVASMEEGFIRSPAFLNVKVASKSTITMRPRIFSTDPSARSLVKRDKACGKPAHVILRSSRRSWHSRLVGSRRWKRLSGNGAPTETGMGLHIMHSRARMISATLTIQRDAQRRNLRHMFVIPTPRDEKSP